MNKHCFVSSYLNILDFLVIPKTNKQKSTTRNV